MNDRIVPAVLAIAFGAALMLAVLVPVVALSYRRRGRFGPRELLMVGTVPVYGLAILTYTLLPLPQVDAAFCAGRSAADVLQTRPFQFVADIARIASRQDAGGMRAWIANGAVQQVVLSVVLFAPLGWLLRGPFHRSLPVTVVAGFGVSLLVEITQYTGNWFLFPCAYRVADVDDLIANTAGALLGALAATLLWSRRSAAAGDPGRPTPVTVGRRMLGAVCDVVAVWASGALLGAVLVAGTSFTLGGLLGPLPDWYEGARELVGYWVPLVLFLAIPLAGAGGTIGQRAVRLRPARPDGGVPSRGRRLLRVLLGTGGLLLLSGPSGALGLLGLVWGVASLVGLFRTTGHTGLAGRITGLIMVDERARVQEQLDARP
ncbi:VanZ family protein [Pseudonocardia parietis]|uniref:Glycopeptide antibiotics resistance protein n=1 Tax=Pseudonocardia parietis TaxID=570936 RepID=A0ABS4VW75_9PSEU|nr:VanZ family protein [Pseudonocardia parietis]MBP2368189.1 glycopeptide antibiotics resistance protein [Pseudonocardia parietis]